MKSSLVFSGEVLKKRLQCGFTQSDMSELLDRSLRWYQEIESGRVTPKFDLACYTCHLLDIDMNKIRDSVPLDYEAIERVKSRKRKQTG